MNRTIPVALALGLVAAGAGWWWSQRTEVPASTWKLGEVQRADVRARVSSTGTLSAVSTVEVGTQVSGVIEALLVDYNDRVEVGQLLARLDTSILQADVRSAQATVDLREAELAQARLELERAQSLSDQQAISAQELLTARTELAVSEASLRTARISLERARQNLGYATILSPIAGTVVERDVEQGQTVNAGMTAPRLFVIAGDLREMQILVDVDESDIGRVAVDQPVEFTVQAFDERRFEGRVRQVRLQSKTEENVVTYTVVVDVDNADLTLLPGMTATVEIIVAEALQVLCVPPAALRFRPEEGQVLASTASPAQAAPPAERSGKGGRGRGGGNGGGRVWLPAGEGKVSAVAVTSGLTDGTCTQIEGEGISEGISVVTGVEVVVEPSAGVTSPFSGSAGAARPPGRP